MNIAKLGGKHGCGETGKMDVSAFKGYCYKKEEAGACLAPPYDVIDDEIQAELEALHEYNFVRINRPKAQTDKHKYEVAAALLRQWIAQGVLQRDPTECFYVLVQDFQAHGQHFRRSGFVGLGMLEAYGTSVKPHEHTLAGPKTDRLNLMRATGAQTGQIFMLYDDPTQTVDKLLAEAPQEQPVLEHVDADGVTHRLFRLNEPDKVARIRQVMQDKKVFIADGHHRYETALTYYQETNNPQAARHMMTFVNTFNEGLVILPTHRLVHSLDNFDTAALVERLTEQFDVARLTYDDVVQKSEKLDMMTEALRLEQSTGEHAFGMYFNDGAFYVATLRDITAMDKAAAEHGPAWRRLDVAVLHKLVLEGMLGIDGGKLEAETHIRYIKDIGQATRKAMDDVDAGRAQGLFFLNETKADDVEAVAAEGEKMPQKSTFFYPKVFSGMVVNVLD